MYLLYFICKDYRPFAVVFKELAPSYKIPSVTTLKKALDNKYEVSKEILKSCLLATLHVCITFQRYNIITVHRFVD